MKLNHNKRIIGPYETLMQAIDVLHDRRFISDHFLSTLNISVVNGDPRKMLKSQGGLRTIETAIKANRDRLGVNSENILAVVTASISSGFYITHIVQSNHGDDVYTRYDDGSLSVTFSEPELTVFSLDAWGLVGTALTINPDFLKNRLISAAQRRW